MITFEQFIEKSRLVATRPLKLKPWQQNAANGLLTVMINHQGQGTGKTLLMEYIKRVITGMPPLINLRPWQYEAKEAFFTKIKWAEMKEGDYLFVETLESFVNTHGNNFFVTVLDKQSVGECIPVYMEPTHILKAGVRHAHATSAMPCGVQMLTNDKDYECAIISQAGKCSYIKLRAAVPFVVMTSDLVSI